MKNKFLILILIIHSLCAVGKVITSNTAKKAALMYMRYRNPTKQYAIKSINSKKENGLTIYYTISFSKGGWIIITADDRVAPVLGYSLDGSIGNDDQDLLLDWMATYQKKLSRITLLHKNFKRSPEWDNIISGNILKNNFESTARFAYTPSKPLVTALWGQSSNNSWTCSPSYNQFAPGENSTETGCFGVNNDKCSPDCSNKPIGCGPVAMAQVMQYWKFPNSYGANGYDWSLLPNELKSSTPQDQADAIGHLLRDCGSAANTKFCCAGSWTLTEDIVKALKDNFGYKGVEKKNSTEWTTYMWQQLIMAEIDAGRPVIYRADEQLIGGAKHLFICDGYRTNPLEFHFNWGWRGLYNGYFNINELNPGGDNYDTNHSIIIGISPTCSQLQSDITNVNYTAVNEKFIHEQALNTIVLPYDGKDLNVNSGGKLIFTASSQITLKPGFSVTAGGAFRSNLQTLGFGESGISSSGPFPNPINNGHVLKLNADNVDSWECEILTVQGQLIYNSAGKVPPDGAIELLTIPTTLAAGAYVCDIRLRNSCGELFHKASNITIYHGSGRLSTVPEEAKEVVNKEVVNNTKISIYPNPAVGKFVLSLGDKHELHNIKISDSNGKVVYENVCRDESLVLDLSNHSKGIYIVQVLSDTDTYIYKIANE